MTTLAERLGSTGVFQREVGDTRGGEDLAATQIRFRRALTVAYGMWAVFVVLDFAVVRFLHAGSFAYFVALRLAVLVLAGPVLLRLYRTPPPSEREFLIGDIITYTSPGVAIALMCVEFRGIMSPYAHGLSLVLLAKTVTMQYPWKRGLVTAGIPVAAFFAVLLGSTAFSPRVAAQMHDAAAITTLVVNASFVLGTYVFLVVGGHVVWSLRQQVFEARNLGRYRLKRKLAAGGMGDVWLAYHPSLKRDVAVKILRPDQRERSASAQARFEREVRATAELMHPNTVRVFDYGVTEDGLWYYVMELLQGETLAEHVLRTGPLLVSRAVHIVGQAARALGEAHEHGIVHRDVKPENLFLTSLGGEHDFIKVIDFGIAKIQTPASTVTDATWVLGTPAYISPEVAVGDTADERSDVYALGAVLYFLLCGRPPFEEDNVAALFHAHVCKQAETPSQVLGRPIPSDVEAVVMRALQKEPAARYRTAADLALALTSCAAAGKWTFGHAVEAARKSSRPPPSSLDEIALPAMPAPRVPRIDLGGPDLPPLPILAEK
jgi:eukaryotic-like serine/threonine-protein kinase